MKSPRWESDVAFVLLAILIIAVFGIGLWFMFDTGVLPSTAAASHYSAL